MQKDDPAASLAVTLNGILEPETPVILNTNSALAAMNPKEVKHAGKPSSSLSNLQIEFDRNNVLRAAYLVHLAAGEHSSLTLTRMETIGKDMPINGHLISILFSCCGRDYH